MMDTSRPPGTVDPRQNGEGVNAPEQGSGENQLARLTPLADGLPLQWTPFPLHCLPAALATYCSECARVLCSDVAYVAVALLVALAGAIGNSRAVRIRPTWVEPAILWAMLVGESNSGKTPAVKYGLRAILASEKEEFARSANAEHARADITGQRTRDGALNESPLITRVVKDVSLAALLLRLHENPRGLVLAVDELRQWFASFNRYNRDAGKELGHWLSLHTAEPIIYDRKSGKPKRLVIPRPMISIIGGIQLGILRQIATRELFDCGLIYRFSLVCPPPKSRRWAPDDVSVASLSEMSRIFSALMDLSLGDSEDSPNEPIVVDLDDEARRLYTDFFNTHHEEIERYTPVQQSALGKLDRTAPRLALIIHQASEAEKRVQPGPINVHSMRAGIELARWFGRETLRIFELLSQDRETAARHGLLDLIHRHGGCISVRELQHARAKFRGNTGVARAELDDLRKAGYGHWQDAARETGSVGRPPDPVFCLGTPPPVLNELASGLNGEGDPPSNQSDQESESPRLESDAAREGQSADHPHTDMVEDNDPD